MNTGSTLNEGLLRSIVNSLSKDRFNSYRDTSDQDDIDVVARYAWNMAICSALYPLLNVFEVTLRNRLFQLISSKYSSNVRPYNTIPCWLDFQVAILTDREVRTVERAKQRLPTARNGQARQATTARLVAELTLDFWIFLFHEPYTKGDKRAGADLWPKMLKSVFPSMAPKNRTMINIRKDLEAIRIFRNRIFHHEPIWKDDVITEVESVLNFTYAMQKDVGTLLRSIDSVTAIVNAGPLPWRERITPLLVVPEEIW